MTQGSVPCERDEQLRKRIVDFSEILKTEAHRLGYHGLDEREFYQSGLFRGAIERIRGQFSASMSEKREFVRHILNYMQDQRAIIAWESAGAANRHDYVVELPSGKKAGVELKGCLDGNNTNINARPPHVQEFIVWSVCSNPGADPRHNVWSGIHTRFSADIIDRSQVIDGLIVWDWICGTIGRSCPKVNIDGAPMTTVGPYKLPPPCIYMFPGTVPSPRNNPSPRAQALSQVEILQAFQATFGGHDKHLNFVDFDVAYQGVETVRRTTISRNGTIVQQSQMSPIKRS